MRAKQIILLVICGVLATAANAQQTYYGYVGDRISLPEPTPPSSDYTVMDMAYSSNSEHLHVISGTSLVEILSYFYGKQEVICNYRMVRQYTIAGVLYDDWKSATAYYYIQCLGNDPGPGPDPDPDPDPDTGQIKDGDIFQSKTDEGYFMWFTCGIFYGEKKAYVSENKFVKEACLGKLIGGKITIPTKAKGLEVIGIGAYSFYKLPSITEVVIPQNVSWVKSSSFYDCASLEKITILRETPPSASEDICDSRIFNNVILFVPKGCVSNYESAKGWKKFKTICEIGTNPSGIDDVKSFDLSVKNVFNLHGQKVDKPVKGLYIVNGRKVLIK